MTSPFQTGVKQNLQMMKAYRYPVAVCYDTAATPPIDWKMLAESVTQVGNVATVILRKLGLVNAQTVTTSGATLAAYNVTGVTITVIDADTFTYPIAGNPVSPAVGQIYVEDTNQSVTMSDVMAVSMNLLIAGTTVVLEGRVHADATWKQIGAAFTSADGAVMFQTQTYLNQFRLRRSVGSGAVKAWAQCYPWWPMD